VQRVSHTFIVTPPRQFQEIKRERWREKDSLTKKHRDVQFAVAQALHAACFNPAASALFRADQMDSIRKVRAGYA
jgi:hypothetical protein